MPLHLQPGDPSWVPVDACCLPTTEQPLRVAELDALFATALTAVHRVRADRVRLVLSGPEGLLDRVEDLTSRETRCCSFFDFTITSPDPATVLMEIAVPLGRADVLAALADRAEAHLAHQGAR